MHSHNCCVCGHDFDCEHDDCMIENQYAVCGNLDCVIEWEASDVSR